MKLRDAARGQDCQVRIPGICNFNPETTVLAHYRTISGGAGVGLKPMDLIGAHACSSCHDAIDGRFRTIYTRDELDLMHLEGLVRTIAWLYKAGKL